MKLLLLLLLCATAQAQTYSADPSTLYQNAAGTVHVTAPGQMVEFVTGVSAPNMTQPIASRACVYELDRNGKSNIDCQKGHCLYSTATFTVSNPVWVAAGYSVVGISNSTLVFGVRNANNAYAGITSTTGYRAAGGIMDPTLGNMTITTATASVSQDVVTVTDVLTGVNTVSIAMNDGTRWPKSVVLGSGYTASGLRVGINTGSAGNTCGSANAVHFYGGAIMDAASPTQMQTLKTDTGIAQMEGQDYDIFITAPGQSNEVGKGTATSSPAALFAAEFEDGAIKPLADPVRHYTTTAAGNTSMTGSMWPAFANAYHAQTGRNALLVGTAVDGVGITTTMAGSGGWLTHLGPAYRAFAASKALAAQAFVVAHGGTATIKALVFEDGEADALANVDAATFEAGITSVRADLNSRLGLPNLPMVCISIDKTTNPSQDTGFSIIRDAINDYCTTQPYTYMVAGYQDFADAGELNSDGLHWGQTALNFMGNLAGQNTGVALP